VPPVTIHAPNRTQQSAISCNKAALQFHNNQAGNAEMTSTVIATAAAVAACHSMSM